MQMTRKIRFNVGLEFQSTLIYLLVCTFFCCFLAQLQSAQAVIRPIDRDAHTIYYTNRASNAHGDFHYEFQTSNGITIKAAGNEYGQSGVVQYISLEGIPITMTYVADADGYHPRGDHIPKLPEQVTSTLLNYKRQLRTAEEKKTKHKVVIKKSESDK
ncbi:pupal cuticle protein Edg-78E-like [Anastrepha obliqua]|uniref:pupal cuticle protein Edg-78E-like n=1 Tax=Anastrepha obliqua TaxID=95512 RepID=UPI00240922A3|nr:pupal cuticle protein Edg-78E-like [Anastrepha obliqua]